MSKWKIFDGTSSTFFISGVLYSYDGFDQEELPLNEEFIKQQEDESQ